MEELVLVAMMPPIFCPPSLSQSTFHGPHGPVPAKLLVQVQMFPYLEETNQAALPSGSSLGSGYMTASLWDGKDRIGDKVFVLSCSIKKTNLN